MPHTTTSPLRRIGWDGIRLDIPINWHPVAVYTDYLLFEEQYQPVCGLKWRRIKGQFDPSGIIKKLQKSLAGAKLHPWQIPQDWQPHLSTFTHRGFSWSGSGESGHGLLLYEEQSERVLFIQLYNREDTQMKAITNMLASLRMEQQEKQLWSMFDIRIHLPEEASLQEHEFLPGSFRLRFSLGEFVLTYYRFKPAAELLKHQQLSTFGNTIAGKTALLQTDEPSLVQWAKINNTGFRFLGRLAKKPRCSTTRLWLPEKENVIFGLKVQGHSQVNEHIFQTLCSDYVPC